LFRLSSPIKMGILAAFSPIDFSSQRISCLITV
jgi:hypothetical protein